LFAKYDQRIIECLYQSQNDCACILRYIFWYHSYFV